MTKWTVDDIPDQSGKVAIVTGANTGIGFEEARGLAQKGAQVIMACRDLDKATAAAQKIRAANPDARLEVMRLDLGNLASVHGFADEFKKRYDRLDILINNAGVMRLPERILTPDGFETQFGVNHLGHFALTGLLIDLILKTPGARVVTVSSSAHRMGKIDFNNLNGEKSYNRSKAYGQSKLANLLFAYELQRKFAAAGIDALSAGSHPGWTATELQRHSSAIRFLNRFFAQQPPMGALPTLYAATASDATGGSYYGPEGLMGWRGYPKKTGSSKRSHDQQVARRLWEKSEELTGVQYPEFGS